MIADPLHAVAVLLAREDVEADLGPAIEALSEFECLVRLMLRRVNAVDRALLALDRVVGMQLHHEIVCRDGIGTVDLNFVIGLRLEERRPCGERE